MNIAVLIKHVPDLVEELEIDSSGTKLDRSFLRFLPSEYDDHALEQALLLKERHGGTVTVYALDFGDVDETLYTASAKGADAVIRIAGAFEDGVDTHRIAAIYADLMRERGFDLILTGVQAIDDLDGATGPILAEAMKLPYVGVVSGVAFDESGNTVTVKKEYPGGLMAEIRCALPAVLGIQAADKPPRYVPVAKVLQARKNVSIQTLDAQASEGFCPEGLEIRRMYKPETTSMAELLEGSIDEVASKLTAILEARGIVR